MRADSRSLGKYAPLYLLLRDSGRQHVDLSFAEIADVVDGGLPPSAYRHRPWWSNWPGHVQAAAWLMAGYEVSTVDCAQRTVRFSRVGR